MTWDASDPPLPEPSLLTPQALIAWRGGPKGKLPESVLLTHQASLLRSLRPFLRREVDGLFPTIYVQPGGRFAVAGNIGVGAPATAMAVEELAACGVKRIVMVDIAASIAAEGTTTVMVVDEAIVADGTSPHYLPEGVRTVPGSANLLGALSQALREYGTETVAHGSAASTDAPFRETPSLIETFRARGAQAVDMETSALYASARALGVEAAALLVIGDSLGDGVWRPPENRDMRGRLWRVARTARGVLA